MMLDINPELPTPPSADGAVSEQREHVDSEQDSSWEMMDHEDGVHPPEIGTDAILTTTASAVQIVESDGSDEEETDDEASSDEEAVQDETALADEIFAAEKTETVDSETKTSDEMPEQTVEDEVIKDMLYKDLVSYILEGEQTRNQEIVTQSSVACVPSFTGCVRAQIAYLARNHTISFLFGLLSTVIALFVVSRVRSTNLPARINELEQKVDELQSVIDRFPQAQEYAVRTAIEKAVKKYSSRSSSHLPVEILPPPAEVPAPNDQQLAYRNPKGQPDAPKPHQPKPKYDKPTKGEFASKKPHDEQQRKKYDSDHKKSYDSDYKKKYDSDERKDAKSEHKKPHNSDSKKTFDSDEQRDYGKGNMRKYDGEYKKKYDGDGKDKTDRAPGNNKYQAKPYADKYGGKYADGDRKVPAFQNKDRYDSDERKGKHEHYKDKRSQPSKHHD